MAREFNLIQIITRFPQATWAVYSPYGPEMDRKTSEELILTLGSPMNLETFPHPTPAKWGEDGSVMVRVGNQPWTKFLRLEEKGELELNEEQVDAFLGAAQAGLSYDHPEVQGLMSDIKEENNIVDW